MRRSRAESRPTSAGSTSALNPPMPPPSVGAPPPPGPSAPAITGTDSACCACAGSSAGPVVPGGGRSGRSVRAERGLDPLEFVPGPLRLDDGVVFLAPAYDEPPLTGGLGQPAQPLQQERGAVVHADPIVVGCGLCGAPPPGQGIVRAAGR